MLREYRRSQDGKQIVLKEKFIGALSVQSPGMERGVAEEPGCPREQVDKDEREHLSLFLSGTAVRRRSVARSARRVTKREREAAGTHINDRLELFTF